MAVLLAESFDQYGTSADMTSLGWTIGSGTLQPSASTPFTQGQSIQNSTSANSYTWGSNETTIYGSVFFKSTGTSGAPGVGLTFNDANTAQCTIRFNMDGSIGLYTGGVGGTLIQTYTSIFTGGPSGTWNSFQFKVVINNSTGSIEIRMNGGLSNIITSTGVNTRGGTSNAYVNGVSMIHSSIGATGYIDNLFLNSASGNAPTSWPGELRALQQYPTSVVTPNFSVFPTTLTVVGAVVSSITATLNTAYYESFVAPNGTTSTGLVSVSFPMNANLTGNCKFAIYDNAGTSGAPKNVLATSSAVTNPTTTGPNVATFSSPPTLTAGTTYYLAYDQDATANYKGGAIVGSYTSSTSYASFPTGTPTLTGPSTVNSLNFTLTFNADNAYGVQELIANSDTSYIYTSSTVEDKYNMSAAVAASNQVICVQYYMMHKKSDVGTRSASLSVAANGSADTNLVTVTSTLLYTYSIVTRELDPTGASWTPTTANGAVVGITAS